MSTFVSIAYSVWLWLESTLFGDVTGNLWYTTNRDTIIGIGIVVVCVLVFSIAVGIMFGIVRFLAKCLDIRS